MLYIHEIFKNMKSLILFLLVFVSADISFSQTRPILTAGLNHGTLNFPLGYATIADNGYRTGFYVGVNTDVELSHKTFLLFGLMYVQKGAKGEPGKAFHKELIMHYLNMPVLFNYRATKWINLYAGPEIGVLFDADINTTTGTVDADRYFQTFDLGLAAGFSVDLNKDLYVEARYIEGLTRLHEGLFKREGAPYDKTGRNRTVQVGLGYRIF